MMARLTSLIAMVVAFLAAAPAQADRLQYDVDPGWKLPGGDPKEAAQPSVDDGACQAVTLPRGQT